MQGFLCRLRVGCRNGGRIGLSRQPCCRRPYSVCRGVIRRRCRTDRGTALIDLIDDQADQIGQQTDEAPVQPGELALGSIPVHPQSNQHPVDTEKQHCECRRNFQRSHPAGNGDRNGDNVDPAAAFMNIHAAEQIDRLGSKTTFKGAVVVVCTELSKILVDDGIQHEFLALDILEHGIRICRRGEILFLRAYLCKLQRSAGKLGVFCGKSHTVILVQNQHIDDIRGRRCCFLCRSAQFFRGFCFLQPGILPCKVQPLPVEIPDRSDKCLQVEHNFATGGRYNSFLQW